MAKFGLAYDHLAEKFPALVYCSLTGYGQTGPMKDRAGHDINFLSLSGLMGYAGRKESGPVPMSMQIAMWRPFQLFHHRHPGRVIHRQKTGRASIWTYP